MVRSAILGIHVVDPAEVLGVGLAPLGGVLVALLLVADLPGIGWDVGEVEHG